MGQDLSIVRIAARLSRIVRGAARVADRKTRTLYAAKRADRI